jgi:receptor-binding and translocation channel-forming TcA subunit of Tc toxin
MNFTDTVRFQSIKRIFQFFGLLLVFNLIGLPMGHLLAMETFEVKKGTPFLINSAPPFKLPANRKRNSGVFERDERVTTMSYPESKGHRLVVPSTSNVPVWVKVDQLSPLEMVSASQNEASTILNGSSQGTQAENLSMVSTPTSLASVKSKRDIVEWKFDQDVRENEIESLVLERKAEGFIPTDVDVSTLYGRNPFEKWRGKSEQQRYQWSIVWERNHDHKDWDIDVGRSHASLCEQDENEVTNFKLWSLMRKGFILKQITPFFNGEDKCSRFDDRISHFLVVVENKENLEWTSLSLSHERSSEVYQEKVNDGFIPTDIEMALTPDGEASSLIMVKYPEDFLWSFLRDINEDDFSSTLMTMEKLGLGLKDFERYLNSDLEQKIAAIFWPTSNSRTELKYVARTLDEEEDIKIIDQLTHQGYRLLNHETYVVPGDEPKLQFGHLWHLNKPDILKGEKICNSVPVLFGRKHYKGNKIIDVDRHVPSLKPYEFDAKALSLCVPEAWRIEIFDQENYAGDPLEIVGQRNIPELSQILRNPSGNWSKEIRSIRVYPPKERTPIQENLYQYWYPVNEIEGGSFPAIWEFQNLMKQGLEFFKKGSSVSALQQYHQARELFKDKWDKLFTPNRASEYDRLARIVDGTLEFLRERKQNKHDVFSLFEHVQVESLKYSLDFEAGGEEGMKYYYYLANFWLPLMISDCYLQLGNFQDAINTLFSIFIESSFYQTSSLNSLEETYGENIGPGVSTDSLPAPNSLNLFGKFPDPYSQRGQLHRIEIRLLQQKIAKIYLRWGETLYRQGEHDPTKLVLAKAKYIQALRIFSETWEKVIIKNSESNIQGLNQDTLRMIYEADLQLTKLKNGLNFLGYPKGYVPIWSYGVLRGITKDFVLQAKGLEREALGFLGFAENEEEEVLLLQQNVSMGHGGVGLEKLRVGIESKTLEISKKSKELAELQFQNKRKELKSFRKSFGLASALGSALEPLGISQFSSEIGVGVGALFGGAAGAQAGGLAGGFFARAQEKRLAEQQLKHTVKELNVARDLAGKEDDRAEIAFKLAHKNLLISQLDLHFREQLLEFGRGKVLNQEFWFKLTKDIREKAKQYFEFGLTLAWLTQQAFVFEESKDIQLIRLDYTSMEDWLAADQLLLDLDTIEFQRVTNTRNKDIPITYNFSLRNNNLLSLYQLRKTGKTTFSTNQLQFDLAYPGTFNRRIEKVEAIFLALAPRSGIHGILTRDPFSLIKTLGPTLGPIGKLDSTEFVNDWPVFTPSTYKLKIVATPSDRMVFPTSGNFQTDNSSPKPNALFRGHGVSGSWTLEIPKGANVFNYDTLFDVVIKIHFSAHYDEELKSIIAKERQKLAGLGVVPWAEMVGISLREEFPDEFYQFHNPRQNTEFYDKHRLIFIPIPADATPPHQSGHTLTEFWLAILGNNGGLPIKAKVTTLGLNDREHVTVENGKIFYDGEKITKDTKTLNLFKWFENFEKIQDENNQEIPGVMNTEVLGPKGAMPFDWWIVRIDAKDNENLRLPGKDIFDPKKVNEIENIVLQMGYDYQVEGGDGSQITMWADFEDDDPNLTFYGKGPFEIGKEQRKKNGLDPRPLPLGAQGHWRSGEKTIGTWGKMTEESNSFVKYTAKDVNKFGILQTSPTNHFPGMFNKNYEVSFSSTILQDGGGVRICLTSQNGACDPKNQFTMEQVEKGNEQTKWNINLGEAVKKYSISLPNSEVLNWQLRVQEGKKNSKLARKMELNINSVLLEKYWDVRKSADVGGIQIGAKGDATFDDIVVLKLGNSKS